MTTTTDTNVVSIIGAAEYVPETGPKAGLHCYNPCSHVANAQRIVSHFGDRLLYVEGIGWHTWGGPWKHDELGARKLVHELGRIISAEAAGLASWVASASGKAERVVPRRYDSHQSPRVVQLLHRGETGDEPGPRRRG